MTSCHGRTNGAPGHRSAFEVGLAGNPNTGKSSILNALTGSRHHVGNWPGKTVARLEGTFSASGIDVLVVDLPGIYSFAASSPEQVIARDYLSAGGRDAVITVVDAANLERTCTWQCRSWRWMCPPSSPSTWSTLRSVAGYL